MFNNLIESSSHRNEFKRRGSFVLFTMGTYVLLFVITGVASIYAYDANLGEQSFEVVTMLPPVDITTPRSPEVATTPRSNPSNHQNYDIRKTPMATVDQPVMPSHISVNQNPELPVRPWVPTIIGPQDVNADLPGSRGGGGNSSSPTATHVNILPDTDPPPLPTPTPVVKRIINASRVLNSQAITLPKPAYPVIAKRAGIQGTVTVQVLIDETGKVISAKAVSGHPLLVLEAQRAALQARFSPTIVGDQPTKVSGVITYNFVIQ